MATQQSTKTITLSGTFTSGPSGLVPAAPTQSIEGKISKSHTFHSYLLTALQIFPFHSATPLFVTLSSQFFLNFLLTHIDGKVKLTLILGIVVPFIGFTLLWLFFKTFQLRFHWRTEEIRKQDARRATQSARNGSGRAPVSREEQQELAATGLCPEGWEWVREGDGFRCNPPDRNGTHTISAAELRQSRQQYVQIGALIQILCSLYSKNLSFFSLRGQCGVFFNVIRAQDLPSFRKFNSQ